MAQRQEIFTLLGGRVCMRRGMYNPTSDAVWLAAMAADAAHVKNVLDVGVGSGGVAICVHAHLPAVSVVGIDTCDKMLAACRDNAELNNMPIELIRADINTWRTTRTFDMVVTNPPYFNGTPAGHNAHHNADLKTWMRRCVARVRPRGTFCTIVDAAQLATVIGAIADRCGDIHILPLFGAKNTAERVILRGRVGVRGGAVMHRGISMNTDAVLRDGLTIDAALATLGLK